MEDARSFSFDGHKAIEVDRLLHSTKKRIAKIYDDLLDQLKTIRIIKPSSNSRYNYFKYSIILLKHNREKVHKAMEEKGISHFWVTFM